MAEVAPNINADMHNLNIQAACANPGCTQNVRFYLDEAQTAAAGGAYVSYFATCVCGAEQGLEINTVKPAELP